jgi:hypothetical protein
LFDNSKTPNKKHLEVWAVVDGLAGVELANQVPPVLFLVHKGEE